MTDLSTVSTRDLQAELSRREGVESLYLGPYDRAEVTGYFGSSTEITIVGPAIITVNID